ncbi:hypothetical protein ABZ883_21850 [Streptomyces sp. NPDC046977]|uniref:hypothetical protein n=1 Tax=Streptomyces sp. NPDC046977 TaxID=3154703 RepID=UPI0033D831C2
MQFIEVTELAGVRSAVVRFRRRGSGLSFVLFPMVHLGERSFYDQVTARLRTWCDLVIAEGIRGESPTTEALTQSYRRLDGVERLGLVVQDIDYNALGVPVVCPDMTGEEFESRWRRVPFRERAAVAALVPVYAAGMRLLGTRRFMARHLRTEDLLTDAEEAAANVMTGMEDVILHRRDRLLLDAVKEFHRARGGRKEPFTVGIVYGAEHMRAVAPALADLGYRTAESEWLTVFALDPPRPRR